MSSNKDVKYIASLLYEIEIVQWRFAMVGRRSCISHGGLVGFSTEETEMLCYVMLGRRGIDVDPGR